MDTFPLEKYKYSFIAYKRAYEMDMSSCAFMIIDIKYEKTKFFRTYKTFLHLNMSCSVLWMCYGYGKGILHIYPLMDYKRRGNKSNSSNYHYFFARKYLD